MLPNIDYDDKNYNKLNNKKIYIVQFPKGKDLSLSEGEIIDIGESPKKELDKFEFEHKASTLPGSSGSPIFL